VHQASVAINGRTRPGAVVSLNIGDAGVSQASTTADSTGAFKLAFDVAPGTTLAQIAVEDPFGQKASTVLTIVRANPEHPTTPAITILSPESGLLTSSNPAITGQVTDKLSALASLQVAIDGGTYAPVSFDRTTGTFEYSTNLAVNGTADGVHTLQFRAADHAGNIFTDDFTFTLDTTGPSIGVTAPAEGAALTTSPTVVGIVSDKLSGVASLRAQVDGGPTVTVPVDASGSFSFPAGLATDGSANGPHTIHLVAADRAGNTSTQAVDFTLEASTPQGPTVTIESPVSGLSTRVNPMITGTVAGNAVTSLQAQVDGSEPTSVAFDPSTGAFRFTPSLPLDGSADGPHTVHFKVTNSAGQSAGTDYRFTLKTAAPTQPAFNLAAADRESGSPLATTDSQVTLVGQTDSTDRHGFWGRGHRYPPRDAEIHRFCNQQWWYRC
jgi:hypothetical protein